MLHLEPGFLLRSPYQVLQVQPCSCKALPSKRPSLHRVKELKSRKAASHTGPSRVCCHAATPATELPGGPVAQEVKIPFGSRQVCSLLSMLASDHVCINCHSIMTLIPEASSANQCSVVFSQITLQHGEIGRQANGAVILQDGDTVSLVRHRITSFFSAASQAHPIIMAPVICTIWIPLQPVCCTCCIFPSGLMNFAYGLTVSLAAGPVLDCLLWRRSCR